MVEFSDSTEKFRKIISVIEFSIKIFKRVKNADEIAHDVREYGDTKEEDEGTDEPFKIAPGCVVAEAHRGKGSEGKVGGDDGDLTRTLVFQTIVNRKLIFFLEDIREEVCLYLAKDPPNDSEEVADDGDDYC